MVLGRGSTGSTTVDREGGGGCRKCLMMAVNWKSTTMGTAFVGDIVFEGKLNEKGAESEDVSRDDRNNGIESVEGRRMSSGSSASLL